jgi:thiol-disulfide isomerase/thioredoxin
MKVLVFILFALIFFVTPGITQSLIKQGLWHASINRPDGKQIVFNLRSAIEKSKTVLYIVNASESMRVPDVKIARDSIFINMPVFESGFKAKIISKDSISGVWHRASIAKRIEIPFTATAKNPQRFVPVNGNATQNAKGKWAISFKSYRGNISPAIGEFQQVNNKVTGSVLSPTGDDRYLEGIVSGDSLYLSGFDGIHALLYTAKIDGSNIDGILYSGEKGKETFTGSLSDNPTLPNSAAMSVKNGEEGSLDFTFKDLDSNDVSINDDRFKNKVVIVDIMGSWCPNCMDETAFLSDYYKKNKARGVEVISLAYELTTNFTRSKNSLLKFKNRFDVTYPILITGVSVADSLKTEKTLSQLTSIKMFPSTIIIDKKGKVSKIDTGFEGPGTGEYYTNYIKEFTGYIDKLLAE